MATFHRDAGRGRAATSSAASSRARPTSCSPAARSHLDPDLQPVARRRRLPRALPRREPAARRAGPARARDRTEGLRPGDVRPERRPPPARSRPDAARARRHRRPAADAGEGGDRRGALGGHPGAHDHGRPRRDGRGDRAAARNRGTRDHRRRVGRDERRRGARGDRRHRRDRARHARGQGAPRRHAEAPRATSSR